MFSRCSLRVLRANTSRLMTGKSNGGAGVRNVADYGGQTSAQSTNLPDDGDKEESTKPKNPQEQTKKMKQAKSSGKVSKTTGKPEIEHELGSASENIVAAERADVDPLPDSEKSSHKKH